MCPHHPALEIFRGGIETEYFSPGAEQHPLERRTGDAGRDQPRAGVFPDLHVYGFSFHAPADLLLPDGYADRIDGVDFLSVELRTGLRRAGAGLYIRLAEYAGKTSSGIGNADRTTGIVYCSDLFPAVFLEKMKIFQKTDLYFLKTGIYLFTLKS